MAEHPGQRKYLDAKGHLFLPPCSYGKDADDMWSVRGPKGGSGILDPKDNWVVTEHDDGTITVNPSLDFPGVWHGYLVHGVFRDA